jgi:hypothetical protein
VVAGGEDRRRIELLIKVHVLVLILVKTCHMDMVGGQSWRRVAMLL